MSTAPDPWLRPALLALDDAVARMLARVGAPAPDRAEDVSTFAALHRVLAADVRSLLDVPPADNSEMDGYALRSGDVPVAGTVLPVSQRIPAGVVGGPLEPGTAARIFTGAQIPLGADAVVMQEQCSAVEAGVRVDAVPKPGQS
ncbi:MAG TPA: molybdopterin molybdenumtransferase MoeA, partial [Caldimonas sp.]|nr:molybdopterin molybdenumtransferase MoeA [Caldimonas sp.]